MSTSISPLTISIKKNSKLKQLKENFIEHLKYSSAHGVPRLALPRNLFFKIMWITFISISITTGSNFVIKNIKDYFEYKTVTTISEITESHAEFPTITFCGYPFINNSLNETVSKVRFNNLFETNFNTVFEIFNDTVWGQCFRYNSGRNVYNQSVKIFNSSVSGEDNGLRLDIHLDVPDEYDFVELLLYIHNHSSSHDHSDLFWIKPGAWNFFQLQRTFSEKLPEPYNDCLMDVNQFKNDKYIIDFINKSKYKYSQKFCYDLCSNLFALKESNCGCNSSFENFIKNCIRRFYEPEGNDTKHCIADYLEKFRKDLQYKNCKNYCPTECNTMRFTMNSYYESLPTTGNISSLRKKEYSLERYENYEQVQKHYVSIYVYYQELKYTLISEEPKTELFSFISSIGGIFGLFLGISFLSFIEILEMFFQFFFIFFYQ
jgi:hypothetical protein